MNLKRNRAFTLVEMLVVIAIIGILAGLIVGLAAPATAQRKLKRAEAELQAWQTAIESYKSSLGYYPPDGTNSLVAPLFYELTGTVFNEADKTYSTINGQETIHEDDVKRFFGRDGFANSQKGKARNFYPTLKKEQYRELNDSKDIELPVAPGEGPDIAYLKDRDLKPINTWRYVSSNPTNNSETYDLWAEITIRGKTQIIGNWKR